MSLQNLVGKTFPNPIVKDPGTPDGSALWGRHDVFNRRARGQTLRATDGTTLTYDLLYYIEGLTTYCALHGNAILTGMMTGCYLFRFRSRGEWRVAHCGTDGNSAANTARAKADWKRYAASAHVTDIMGCNPASDISAGLLQAAAGRPAGIIGAWEANGAFRIGLFTFGTDMSMATLAGLEPAPLRPWSEIQNEPRMR